MTLGLTKGGKLQSVITQNVIWTNHNTELFVHHLLRAHAKFVITLFYRIVPSIRRPVKLYFHMSIASLPECWASRLHAAGSCWPVWAGAPRPVSGRGPGAALAPHPPARSHLTPFHCRLTPFHCSHRQPTAHNTGQHRLGKHIQQIVYRGNVKGKWHCIPFVFMFRLMNLCHMHL